MCVRTGICVYSLHSINFLNLVVLHIRCFDLHVSLSTIVHVWWMGTEEDFWILLWTITWVLGIEPRYSGKVVGAFNHWAIYSALVFQKESKEQIIKWADQENCRGNMRTLCRTAKAASPSRQVGSLAFAQHEKRIWIKSQKLTWVFSGATQIFLKIWKRFSCTRIQNTQ